MTPEQAVRDRLLSVAGVTSIVASRVYQLTLPQDVRLPAVKVQLVSEDVPYHLRGPVGLTSTMIQVDAYSPESGGGYAIAASLAQAIDVALRGVVFNAGALRVSAIMRQDRRVLYETGELRMVRILQDYVVWSETVN